MIKKLWNEKLAEPLEEIQERLRQHWLSLAPRERMIVSILGSVLLFLLAVLLVKEAYTFFSRHENQITESMSQMTDIQQLSAELSRQRNDLSQFERLRSRRSEDFKLSTFLETEARKYGVTLEKVSPTKPRDVDVAKEEDWMEVRLAKDTTLDNALKFLRSVEEVLGVRLIDLQIRPQFTDPTKLEVIATVASRKEI